MSEREKEPYKDEAYFANQIRKFAKELKLAITEAKRNNLQVEFSSEDFGDYLKNPAINSEHIKTQFSITKSY